MLVFLTYAKPHVWVSQSSRGKLFNMSWTCDVNIHSMLPLSTSIDITEAFIYFRLRWRYMLCLDQIIMWLARSYFFIEFPFVLQNVCFSILIYKYLGRWLIYNVSHKIKGQYLTLSRTMINFYCFFLLLNTIFYFILNTNRYSPKIYIGILNLLLISHIELSISPWIVVRKNILCVTVIHIQPKIKTRIQNPQLTGPTINTEPCND